MDTGNNESNITEAIWLAFEHDVHVFDVQHVQEKGKFAFSFVEGPLIKALRSGDWQVLRLLPNHKSLNSS
jgi:midasin (ATPase involved in ribosome maturation)